MSETASSAPSTRRTNGWRTSTLVLILLCMALGVGWYMRERQLRIDHDQERQDSEIQIRALQKELDARPALADDDTATSPSTRPAVPPA